MNDIIFNFTLTELIAFLGLVQSVYILVYILFRSQKVVLALIPLSFFILLASAFFIVVAQKYWIMPIETYNLINWFIWTFCAPISFLLVIQIARITKPPPLGFFPIIVAVPLVYYLSSFIHGYYDIGLRDILLVSATIVGTLTLLLIWLKRSELDKLHKRQNGKERFWLIISIIVLNLCLISLNLTFINEAQIDLARILIGIGFIYVTSTSLFRVYPPTIRDFKKKASEGGKNKLSSEEVNIAIDVENLLHVQKVYQEPNYNRASMAKELDISEAQLSKIVNTYFSKNVPLLLNELRVEEAKALLKQTKEDISLIAEEAGFNSIATFNRVFKDLTGVSPNMFRQAK